MNKRSIVTVVIFALIIVVLVVSILDKPDITHDAFSILVISWLFYETLNQRTDIQRLFDEVRKLKEVIKKWQDTNFRSQSR